ncbi:hypothetical protein GCM10022384_07130 [Streptomyces marokkonensis]|uniref:Uncharacterized protein n=1 Tax=Streptomyces marokkonensis TaxID=324855 RepID=A0ABP7NY79_9ACTN
MTITEPETAPVPEEAAEPSVATILRKGAKGPRERAVAQALIEEQTILELNSVRSCLLTEDDGVWTCRWEGLLGRQYGLGLDEEQRAFFGLVLSLLGVGMDPLSAARKLDERRLMVLLRAILKVNGNKTIAVGKRI